MDDDERGFAVCHDAQQRLSSCGERSAAILEL